MFLCLNLFLFLACFFLELGCVFKSSVSFLDIFVESDAAMIAEMARMKWVISISLVFVLYLINLIRRCFYGLPLVLFSCLYLVMLNMISVCICICGACLETAVDSTACRVPSILCVHLLDVDYTPMESPFFSFLL